MNDIFQESVCVYAHVYSCEQILPLKLKSWFHHHLQQNLR